MQNTENKISLTGNGNIVIQDSKNGNITINQNDPQLFEKLQKLSKEQISVLQQMINEHEDKFSDLLKTLVSGIASQKNIVQNSTIIAKKVKIGDTVEYHYHYSDKNTTQNADKIYNINKIDKANFS